MSRDYQIRHPRNRNEVNAVFDLLEECFSKVSRLYFVKRILSDGFRSRNNTYILIKEKKIISHVHLFRQKIYCRGAESSAVGLGGICTFAEYRNKGYCQILLKKVIQDLSEDKTNFVFLLTRLSSFYQKLGFAEIEKRYCLIRLKDNKLGRLKNKENLKIEKFKPKKDISTLRDIYRNYFGSWFGPKVRALRDWQGQLSYFDEDQKLFLVLREKNQAKAYLRCKRFKRRGQEIIDIVEYASVPSGFDFFIHLLRYLQQAIKVDHIRVDTQLAKHIRPEFLKGRIEKGSSLMYRFPGKPVMNERLMSEIVFLEADAF